MKYCIGCKHWRFEAQEEQRRLSTVTIDDAYPASMSCTKGHWQYLELDSQFLQSDFEKAMETAETCADFEERPAPEVLIK